MGINSKVWAKLGSRFPNNSHQRLLPVNCIPLELWSEGRLSLPDGLIRAWEMLLDFNGIDPLSSTDSGNPAIIGGKEKEPTLLHLKDRFTGSCAKAILTLLDPNQRFETIPDSVIKMFTQKEIFLVDLPCGSGAASMGILSALALLREKQVVPRTPIKVQIFGGDVSETGRVNAQLGLEFLNEELKMQGIFLEHNFLHWDLTDPNSNSQIVREINRESKTFATRLMLISHFSGFLSNDANIKKSQAQIKELLRHFYEKGNHFLSIEPGNEKIVKKFYSKFFDFFREIFNYFKKNPSKSEIPGFQEKTFSESVSVNNPFKKEPFKVHMNTSYMRMDGGEVGGS